VRTRSFHVSGGTRRPVRTSRDEVHVVPTLREQLGTRLSDSGTGSSDHHNAQASADAPSAYTIDTRRVVGRVVVVAVMKPLYGDSCGRSVNGGILATRPTGGLVCDLAWGAWGNTGCVGRDYARASP
jgi:hypothetical protein